MISPAPLYDHTDAARSAMILRCGCKFAPEAHRFTCSLWRPYPAQIPGLEYLESNPHTRVGY